MGSDCLWSDPVLGHDSWKKHLWAGDVTDLSIQCMGDSALLKWHYGQLNKNLLRTHCMLGTVPGAGELAIKKPQDIWEVVVETGINT